MKTSLIFFLFCFNLFAAGEGENASILDLTWPAFNALLFFSFLIFKMKKPLTNFFEQNAKNIMEYRKSAQEKQRETERKLSEAQKKMENIRQDSQRIMEQTKADTERFKEVQEKEAQEKVERFRKEAQAQVAFENTQTQKENMQKILSDLVNLVGDDISNDPKLSRSAANRILSNLEEKA